MAKREAAKKTLGSLSFDADKLTVAEYLTRWLNDSVRGSVRERSYIKYESAIRVHIIPELSRLKLKKLTGMHLASFYRKKQDEVSVSSVRSYHALIKRALKQAVRFRLLAHNPAEDVDPPRSAPRQEMRHLSRDEVGILFEAVRGDRLEALFVTAVLSGLRAGELLGLGWEDVDFDKQTLRVRRQLVRGFSSYRFGPPKTMSSRRTVSIKGRKVVEVLRRHRARQLEEKLATRLWQDCGVVFTTRRGTPIEPKTITEKYLRPVTQRAGLPDIRTHDLRHTFATLSLTSGTPVSVVSKMMGHADIAETLNVYSHVLPENTEQAAQTLDNLF
jgi:integrase